MRLGFRPLAARMALHSGLAAALVAGLIACSPEPTPDSHATDIFRQDEAPGNGNARRHKATGEELFWTIDMGGCTGHLIAPEYMMTAAHCSPRVGARYTSGAAISRGARGDITVDQVVEISGGLDYAILRIRWQNGYDKQQKFPPLIATKPTDIRVGRGAEEGDVIYTVGFPGDKRSSWGATYSEGRAKEVVGSLLRYNIGIINGNSGGGVWRKSDRMLVSLTNGGPNILGQGTWRGGDVSDSRHWNHGAAMWNVYAASTILKDIFPNGKNRYIEDTDQELEPIFVAIDSPDRGAVDSFKMLISVPTDASEVAMCETTSPRECNDGAVGYVAASRARNLGSIAVFRSNEAVALSDGLTLSFAAFDASGKLIAGRAVRIEKK